MDSNNYVAPAPGGGFNVVVGGQLVGNFPTQSQGEQQYNNSTGQPNSPSSGSSEGTGGTVYDTPNGPKTLAQIQQGLQQAGYNGAMDPASMVAAYNRTSSAGASGGGSSSSSSQNLLNAIATGNQAQIDEAIREFNATLAQTTQNDKANQQQAATNSYSNLATTLLDDSTKLQGPADYFQYQKMLSGGNDIFQQIYGNLPRANFSAPQGGQITPQSITDIMQRLGFTQQPGVNGSPTSPGAAGSYTTVNGARTAAQMLAELKSAGWPPAQNGGNPSEADIVAAYSSTTKNPVTPMMQASSSQAQGATTQSVQTPGYNTGNTTEPASASQPAPTGTSPSQQNPTVPLPYQISPAIWDGLGSVGQGLVTSAASAAVWDPTDYTAQINATRPKGSTPSTSYTTYQAPGSAF